MVMVTVCRSKRNRRHQNVAKLLAHERGREQRNGCAIETVETVETPHTTVLSLKPF